MQEIALVELKKNQAVCSSLDVAERFGKRHDKLTFEIERMYKNLIQGSLEMVDTPMFWKSTYIHPQNNQVYPMYIMNRDGFSLLVMGFTGAKALEWKLKYIQAFNQMQQMIMEKNTTLWLEQRTQGKLVRKEETDTIQQLTEYAKLQGSEHSNMLYMTYSKLANKMAKIETRESASVQQLSELTFIENIILNQIVVGMKAGMHYKEIYQDCKKQIELFKNIAYLS